MRSHFKQLQRDSELASEMVGLGRDSTLESQTFERLLIDWECLSAFYLSYLDLHC